MDTRTDWDAALEHEDARVARYGRPACVLVVHLDVAAGAHAERADPKRAAAQRADPERVAATLALAIRAAARETDRVARVGPGRFHVLLPETDETEAAAIAERIRAACGEHPIHLASASPAQGRTLIDSLAVASARLERSMRGPAVDRRDDRDRR